MAAGQEQERQETVVDQLLNDDALLEDILREPAGLVANAVRTTPTGRRAERSPTPMSGRRAFTPRTPAERQRERRARLTETEKEVARRADAARHRAARWAAHEAPAEEMDEEAESVRTLELKVRRAHERPSPPSNQLPVVAPVAP